MSTPQRLVPVAEIARPHGVAGELRVRPYNIQTTLLGKGRAVVVRLPSGEESRKKISSVRPSNDALLVRLEGVSGRDAADALRGAQMLVARDEFPPPEDGEFYAIDVEGARAELNGEAIGTVLRLVTYPACEVLEVKLAAGKTIEVPMTEAYVEAIDTDAYVVRLRTIEDLE